MDEVFGAADVARLQPVERGLRLCARDDQTPGEIGDRRAGILGQKGDQSAVRLVSLIQNGVALP